MILVDLVTLIAVSVAAILALLLTEHLEVVAVIGLVVMVDTAVVMNLVGVTMTLAAVITWVIGETPHFPILVALVLMGEILVGDMVGVE